MLETLRALLLKLKLAPASAIARPTESSELESSELESSESTAAVSNTQRYMDDFAAECFYEDYEDLE
jgi:hypothetical protein